MKSKKLWVSSLPGSTLANFTHGRPGLLLLCLLSWRAHMTLDEEKKKFSLTPQTPHLQTWGFFCYILSQSRRCGDTRERTGWNQWHKVGVRAMSGGLCTSLCVCASWLRVPPSTSPAACGNISLKLCGGSAGTVSQAGTITRAFMWTKCCFYLLHYQYNILYYSRDIPSGAPSSAAAAESTDLLSLCAVFILYVISLIFLGTVMCYLCSNSINVTF